MIMKRLTILFSMLLLALTACKNNDFDTEYEPVKPKYVDTITRADGATLTLGYDSDMRVNSVTWTDATESRHYDIVYNLDTTTNTATFDILHNGKKYTMNFNEYGALKSYVLNGDVPQVLSTFTYYNSITPLGAFRLELIGMVDKLTGGEVRRIDWQGGTPMMQISEIVKVEDGNNCTYSTSVRYGYQAYRSNIHANVNLFNLMTPEYLEHSNLPMELRVAVSAFGSRSYYLPTDVTVVNGRMPAGENYEKLSEEEREYTYDTDSEGYILKIYTGKDDDNTKELLYEITYLNVATEK